MSEAAIGTTPTAPTNITAATRRTLILSLGLIVASVVALAAGDLLAHSPPNQLLAWWSIALLAIAAEFMVFDVEFRREVYSFTFSEMPMVLGLFLADPRDLILGRLLGELVYLVVSSDNPSESSHSTWRRSWARPPCSSECTGCFTAACG